MPPFLKADNPNRTKGLCIALFGVLIITPDAVLVRYLSSGGVDPWTILFWRMIFSFPITFTFAWYDIGGYTGLKQLLFLSNNTNTTASQEEEEEEGKTGVSSPPSSNKVTTATPKLQTQTLQLWAAAVLPQVGTNIGFIFAFANTTAAHALLLVNLNPLWCAVAGRLFLGDTLPVRTIVALFLAMGCLLITFVPDIVQKNDEDDDDEDISSTTKGNMIALVTGFSIATYITLVRKGGIEGINMTPVSPMAAITAAILSVGLQHGKVLPTHIDDDESTWQDPEDYWKFWLAMLAEGTIIGIVFIALVLAPRLITGAELALVLLLEVIIGPLWVFWAYKETPSMWTLIGGLSLVLVLAFHEIIPLLFHNKKTNKIEDITTEDNGPEKQETLTSQEPGTETKESING
jgi:drug/metabolite transporter (DMT)-like permease